MDEVLRRSKVRNLPVADVPSVEAVEMKRLRPVVSSYVLDQQIELVAKLFNDPVELPTTLEDGRSDTEDGG
jgi:hypothetical protein